MGVVGTAHSAAPCPRLRRRWNWFRGCQNNLANRDNHDCSDLGGRLVVSHLETSSDATVAGTS